MRHGGLALRGKKSDRGAFPSNPMELALFGKHRPDTEVRGAELEQISFAVFHWVSHWGGGLRWLSVEWVAVVCFTTVTGLAAVIMAFWALRLAGDATPSSACAQAVPRDMHRTTAVIASAQARACE